MLLSWGRSVGRIKLRASLTLSKYSITEPHPSSNMSVFFSTPKIIYSGSNEDQTVYKELLLFRAYCSKETTTVTFVLAETRWQIEEWEDTIVGKSGTQIVTNRLLSVHSRMYRLALGKAADQLTGNGASHVISQSCAFDCLLLDLS